MPFLVHFLCVYVILFFLATLMIISISGVLKFHMFTHHPFFIRYGRNLIRLCNFGYFCLGEIFLFYFFGKFSLLFSLFSLFFETSIDLTLLPASTLLIVWHFLPCLPSFCPFIQPFKKDFLNLIAYFSCHIFSFELFFLFIFSCFVFIVFCSCLMDITFHTFPGILNILYIFILLPAKSFMSPSLFLYSLVYFDLSDVKNVFSCVVILGCP